MKLWRLRALIAVAFGAASSVGVYAWVRLFEAWRLPQASPLAIVSTSESGFFPRIGVALFVGSMGGFGGFVLAERLQTAGKWLVRVLLFSMVLLLIQIGVAP
ncbi:MAG: hypothetical protein IPK82_02615 [Polyangiaceae bacterium]|nr:hypothetical protein [Polyangiaceae bacterium]